MSRKPEPDKLSIPQTCVFLDVCPAKVHKLANAGIINRIYDKRRVYFDRAQLERVRHAQVHA
jgi:hypothetical protein